MHADLDLTVQCECPPGCRFRLDFMASSCRIVRNKLTLKTAWVQTAGKQVVGINTSWASVHRILTASTWADCRDRGMYQ